MFVLLALHVGTSRSRTLRARRDKTDLSGGSFRDKLLDTEAVGMDDTASSLQLNDESLQVASKDETTIESPVAISLEQQDALQTSEQQVWTDESRETVEASEPLPDRALQTQAARSSAVPQRQDQVFLLQDAEREALLKQQAALQASEKEQDSLVAREKDLEVQLVQAKQNNNELASAQARSGAGGAPDDKATEKVERESPSATQPQHQLTLDEDNMSTDIKVAIYISTAFLTLAGLGGAFCIAKKFSGGLQTGDPRTGEDKDKLYGRCREIAMARFSGWPANLPFVPDQGVSRAGVVEFVELAGSKRIKDSTINIMHEKIYANEKEIDHALVTIESGGSMSYMEIFTSSLILVMIPLQGSFGSPMVDTLLKVVMCVLAIVGAILKGANAQFQPSIVGPELLKAAQKEQDTIEALSTLSSPFSPQELLYFDELELEGYYKDQKAGIYWDEVYGCAMNEYLEMSIDTKKEARQAIRDNKKKDGDKGSTKTPETTQATDGEDDK